MIVAVITARGGSKRIPQKNIREFAGKPMLTWPLAVAQKASIFDKIIVSTDSLEIAEVGKTYGAEIPFMRPADLSDDFTPTAPVFLHAIDMLESQGHKIEFACCLYPTAPFLLPEYLQAGLEEVKNNGAPSSLSVTSFAFPILRSFKVDTDGSLSFQWPEYAMTRSQDLPEFYHDAGQFYWVNVNEFRKSKALVMQGTRPIILPRKRVQDIDTLEDWENAELMARALLAKRM